MQESGYATAQIGKWHLGWEDEEPVDYSKGYLGRGPKDFGFDYSYLTPEAPHLPNNVPDFINGKRHRIIN